MLIALSSETPMLVLTSPRELLVRPLLAVCLLACLVWVVLCLVLLPIVMFVRSWQRKPVGAMPN